METIVCSPEGSAVPSGNCTVPSEDGNCSAPKDCTIPLGDQTSNSTALSVDHTIQSHDVNPQSATWPAQSDSGAIPPAMQSVPDEDSLHSTKSCNDLVV